ncbi:MAG TPA: type II secretion system protein [Burkholderiales bacterium]|nr:type II secretion system protein [Burkholderiales bacterium]
MFIIIVGIGVAGLMLIFTVTAKTSSDPVIGKQMLAIAEALMEEVQTKPFTYCDPDDAQAATATSASVGPTGCQVTVEGLGAEGETRYDLTLPFDNVNDYNGFNTSTAAPPGIADLSGTVIGALGAYSATIAVAGSALGGIAAAESLLITVTVSGPGNNSLALQGYRTRYAPNAVP